MSDRRETASDTGPLITLEKLSDGYRFIRLLYDKIVIPHTVLDELVQGQFLSAQAYLEHYGIEDLLEVVDTRGDLEVPEVELLDAGEREAIQAALERGLPLLIEEEAGRDSKDRKLFRLDMRAVAVLEEALRPWSSPSSGGGSSTPNYDLPRSHGVRSREGRQQSFQRTLCFPQPGDSVPEWGSGGQRPVYCRG